MEKVRIAMVGAGGISQIVRIPALKKMEDVDLVALCDVDEAKASFIAEKFEIENVYFDIEDLLAGENLDGIFLCTPNSFHYPMALATIEHGIPTLVEKPLAVNAGLAEKLADLARKKNVPLMVGMNNRFRDDATILREFIQQDELGEPFYVKTGWLRRWAKLPHQNWMNDVKLSGGGVIMDMGIQLIDLVLWLLGKPGIRSVKSYIYHIFNQAEVEDSALAIIETVNDVVITIEVAWQLHLERDMNYTHFFGKKGAAFMNPLRLFRELHGNLVNVTPVNPESNAEEFKSSFELEIRNFIDVVRQEAEPLTPVEDGVYTLRAIDAIYESAKQGKQIDLVTEN